MTKGILAALYFVLTLFYTTTATAVESDKALMASEWRAYLETLTPLSDGVAALLPNSSDPQMRQEAYRLMFAEIAGGYIGLLHTDPQYPDFWPTFSQVFNHGGPNADNVYYAAPIEDSGTYRISGFRGTRHLVTFGIGADSIISRGTSTYPGTSGWGPTLANYDLDRDVHLGKDGSFEVLISPTRPNKYKGDWWPLPPTASYVIVRQTSYDWLHEVDGRMAIERLDRAAMKPRPSAAEIEANLNRIHVWAENYMKLSLLNPIGLREKGLINKFAIHPFNSEAGLKSQHYQDGVFELGPDEALILEIEVPKKCRYWSMMLTNDLQSTLDLMNHQTSLNGYSAKRDADEKFRLVVSATDPGVPNWLDTVGYKTGTMLGRWEGCNQGTVASTQKIRVADVRQYVPSDTPVVTTEARDASIRLRRKAAQLRRRW